jgi:hypothetical protein
MIDTFIENLLFKVHQETEYLQTTEGDEVECISIESLDGILKRLIKEFKNN